MTEENHGIPCSSCSFVGPSWYKLITSQQSGIERVSSDNSSYLNFASFENAYTHLLQNILCTYFGLARNTFI